VRGKNVNRGEIMTWQHIRIARFGGPEVLELTEELRIPEPSPGEVRIRILAAGTGFTDTFIRRGGIVTLAQYRRFLAVLARRRETQAVDFAHVGRGGTTAIDK
jgi:hypothetical protein